MRHVKRRKKDENEELLNQVQSEWLNVKAEGKLVADPWTIFKEALAKGAGGALGQKRVDLGITILSGGIPDIGQTVSLAVALMPSQIAVSPPLRCAESVEHPIRNFR